MCDIFLFCLSNQPNRYHSLSYSTHKHNILIKMTQINNTKVVSSSILYLQNLIKSFKILKLFCSTYRHLYVHINTGKCIKFQLTIISYSFHSFISFWMSKNENKNKKKMSIRQNSFRLHSNNNVRSKEVRVCASYAACCSYFTVKIKNSLSFIYLMLPWEVLKIRLSFFYRILPKVQDSFSESLNRQKR